MMSVSRNEPTKFMTLDRDVYLQALCFASYVSIGGFYLEKFIKTKTLQKMEGLKFNIK